MQDCDSNSMRLARWSFALDGEKIQIVQKSGQTTFTDNGTFGGLFHCLKPNMKTQIGIRGKNLRWEFARQIDKRYLNQFAAKNWDSPMVYHTVQPGMIPPTCPRYWCWAVRSILQVHCFHLRLRHPRLLRRILLIALLRSVTFAGFLFSSSFFHKVVHFLGRAIRTFGFQHFYVFREQLYTSKWMFYADSVII
jgi:hypothetical protein